jgi:hypothetical protein
MTNEPQNKRHKSESQHQQNAFAPAEQPILRFSPTAWAKLLYFRDKSENEVGGFGITEPDDLLFVTEFATVKQEVTGASVLFDDEAVADYFDRQVDMGRRPEQFARLWCHTHPFESAQPSTTDEETFARVFADSQWAVMFIVAQNNTAYARLSFHVGPGGHALIPVKVDYRCPFPASDREAWDAEYAAHVRVVEWLHECCCQKTPQARDQLAPKGRANYAVPYDFMDEFERMEPAERQFILDELAGRPELWDQEGEVMTL